MSVFLEMDEDRIIYRGDYFFIINDGFPVSPGHMLIISNEVKATYFDLNQNELDNLSEMIHKAKELIEQDYDPDGYNIGVNCGDVAGQTVHHFHCHVIPRYSGDMDDPRGGVRGVIPSKQKY